MRSAGPGPVPTGDPRRGGRRRTGGGPGGPRQPPRAFAAHARRAAPPGRAAGEGERLSTRPFSSWPPVSAGGATGSSRPESSCCRRHGARWPPGSARSEGEQPVSDTRRPPGSAGEHNPPRYLRAPPPPPVPPLRGRAAPAIAPRLHGQDNMAPAGAHPEVKGVTVLTLAWCARAPAAAIFVEGGRAAIPVSLARGSRNAAWPPSLLRAAPPVPPPAPLHGSRGGRGRRGRAPAWERWESSGIYVPACNSVRRLLGGSLAPWLHRSCLVTGQQRAAQESQLFSGIGVAACRQSQCGGEDRPDYSYSSSSCKSFASSQMSTTHKHDRHIRGFPGYIRMAKCTLKDNHNISMFQTVLLPGLHLKRQHWDHNDT